MNLRSHYRIGLLIQQQEPFQFTFWQRGAFLLGCMEPDINPATRLQDGKGVQGHSYPNLLPAVQTLFGKLWEAEYMGILDCYRLGKLTHYMTDAFTYPHNPSFTGTLKEHISYERSLAKELSASASREGVSAKLLWTSSPYRFFLQQHEHYLKEEPGEKTDIAYTLKTVSVAAREVYLHIVNDNAACFKEVPYENTINI